MIHHATNLILPSVLNIIYIDWTDDKSWPDCVDSFWPVPIPLISSLFDWSVGKRVFDHETLFSLLVIGSWPRAQFCYQSLFGDPLSFEAALLWWLHFIRIKSAFSIWRLPCKWLFWHVQVVIKLWRDFAHNNKIAIFFIYRGVRVRSGIKYVNVVPSKISNFKLLARKVSPFLANVRMRLDVLY